MPTTTMIGSQELADAAGVTYRQLDYWVRNGTLTPTVESTGSGRPRAWDPDMVGVVALLGLVSKLQADPELLHDVAKAYWDGMPGKVVRGPLTLSWKARQ